MPRSSYAGIRRRFAALGGRLEAWATRHWPALGGLVYAVASAITFGGAALAAYDCGLVSGYLGAALCGALAVYFARFYARKTPALVRLIDVLHPPLPGAPARPDEIPGWAVVLHALIGVALVLTIIAQEETYTRAGLELFVAWAAARHLLDGFWVKRDGTTAIGTAFETFDRRLDDWARLHRLLLRRLGAALGFAMLFGGVALYAWQADVTRTAALICGLTCQNTTGFETMTALACGALAVIFVALYTRLTLAAQRTFIDPWTYVRPEPKPESAAKWVVVLHVLLGFVLLFVMTGIGQMQIPHRVQFSGDGPEAAGLLLGWWIGGRIVLGFLWARWRRGEIIRHRTTTSHMSSTP